MRAQIELCCENGVDVECGEGGLAKKQGNFGWRLSDQRPLLRGS